jgi:ABC-type multidrug transport system fused ATPase/permease subunit
MRIEIKLAGMNSDFVRDIHTQRKKLTRIQSQGQLLVFLPRYLLEIALILGIGIAIFYASAFEKNRPLLAVVALLVASGFRILPSLNAVILGIGSFRNSVSSLNRMDELGHRFGIRKNGMTFDVAKKASKLIQFEGDLIFDNVTYRFPNSKQPIYSKFNFVLRRNTTLLVTGESGSGKTTLIALATGILGPQSGKIVMQNHGQEVSMSNSISGISYLRQDVPLFDESFGYNIAMTSRGELNQSQLTEAAKGAGILERILRSPDAFDTRIGENGSLLSAGEKQRLGLARSLFTKPSLLILDEPTANLDSDSESLVWDSLRELKGKISILIVSHREVPIDVFDELTALTAESRGTELPPLGS